MNSILKTIIGLVLLASSAGFYPHYVIANDGNLIITSVLAVMAFAGFYLAVSGIVEVKVKSLTQGA